MTLYHPCINFAQRFILHKDDGRRRGRGGGRRRAVRLLRPCLRFGPFADEVWPPFGVQVSVESVGNVPINDALLQEAGDSQWRARALVKLHMGRLSLNESIFKWPS